MRYNLMWLLSRDSQSSRFSRLYSTEYCVKGALPLAPPLPALTRSPIHLPRVIASGVGPLCEALLLDSLLVLRSKRTEHIIQMGQECRVVGK